MTTAVPADFTPGLEGVVAFTTEIAEPDKDGGNLRYRGVDIEDLVENRVTFGDVWALLVDGRFGHSLDPAPPLELVTRTGDVRVDVQAALPTLAPLWGFEPLLDIDDEQARVGITERGRGAVEPGRLRARVRLAGAGDDAGLAGRHVGERDGCLRAI